MIELEKDRIIFEIVYPHVVTLKFKNGKERTMYDCQNIEIDKEYVRVYNYYAGGEIYKVKKCLIKEVS